jgi:2,3-bisphosphoglycerate-independent phosphoglycerate mutase
MSTPHSLIQRLISQTPSKIVLVVFDGLGGAQDPRYGKTELEAASHPFLDELASRSACGLSLPVLPGITPGSGPGHLGIFGYDPIQWEIGRGLLDGMGIGFPFEGRDLCARGNLCTADADGVLTDRRAGRLSTEKCRELCALLSGMTIDGVKVFVQPVRDYRVLVVFRGSGLEADLADADPQREGVKPPQVLATNPRAQTAAAMANKFLDEARKRLAPHAPANSIVIRGFSKTVQLPSFQELYGLNPAVIAIYPMYKGLAKLVGMKELEAGSTIADEVKALKDHWNKFDFFFFHIKWADSAGEDGDFDRKAAVFEEMDPFIKEITSLKPDVLAITGDHSTPAVWKGHSWHPVPVLIQSRACLYGGSTRFTELECAKGTLGRISARDIMPLLLANAGKLAKYGA